MSTGVNGQQKAAINLQRFQQWIDERDRACDWQDYWDYRRDQLIRTEIGTECGFGTSALRQNPAIKASLESLEARLRIEMGIGSAQTRKESQSSQNHVENWSSDEAVNQRLAKAKSGAERRIKALEEENATLRAELTKLRELQRQYSWIDEHLSETGRMVRP
ncbi:hypothetical protein MasN3_16100 [Massilia varians]|uniref:Uncharacterized protein n=1 Tax=Massilia varians TaxID=457921 RepID=A0ABM8C4H5_9BURK|nr:VPA1267 family protein [Massilia varians]BDT58116.1 hypothetical protein MasN3_16100 [Massilia varians]